MPFDLVHTHNDALDRGRPLVDSLTAMKSTIRGPSNDVHYGEAGAVQGPAPAVGYDLVVLFSGTKRWSVTLKTITREASDDTVWAEQNA